MANKVYEIITEKILEKLEAGEVPWHRPWAGGYPKNLVSKKEYRGINVFILGCQTCSNPYWLSFKQCAELGRHVRKGEKGTMVVFWKQVSFKKEDDEISEKTIPLLRYYTVFNVDQCEGIDLKKIPELNIKQDFQPIEICENIVNGMQNKPDIQFKESRAYYQPSGDFVNMPKKETFEKEEFFYSVLFHELGHSTGHKNRLDRKDMGAGSFGTEKYSKEELVAEMTAAFLCGISQIELQTIENSAAYIQSWLKALKNDVKMVVLAAAQAQKAADYILNKI